MSSANDYEIQTQTLCLIDTGVQIQVPYDCYGRIAARSSLASKYMTVHGGVIDKDYRGTVKVLLYNGSDSTFFVKTGDRVAQFICEKISYPKAQECQELEILADGRGANGFGSTGVGRH